MDDLIKFFELLVVGEDDPAQRGAIEMAVRRQDVRSPSGDDLLEGRRAELDRAPRQHIGVDDRRAALGEHLGDGRFATADVAGESNQEHDGFLGDGTWAPHPASPSYGSQE